MGNKVLKVELIVDDNGSVAVRKFGRNTEETFKKSKKGASALDKSLDKMGKRIFALGTAWAVIHLGKDIIQTGAKFEQTMATVRGVSGATKEEFVALERQAALMGETTSKSATESAEALLFLSMAGFEAEQSISALPGVINLSIAGAIDLGRAADIASNALTAMQLDVEELGRVNDVFVTTITSSNTNMEMMAESFKYSAAQANAYGYNIEELSAMIGILGNAGIQGSMAGTQLAFSMNKVAKVYEKLGIDGEGKKLIDALYDINKAQWGVNEVMGVFGARGGRAVLVLKNLIPEYEGLKKANLDAAGATEKLAKLMQDTTQGSLKELGSALEAVKIVIFDIYKGDVNKAIKSTTSGVRSFKQAIEDLHEPTDELKEKLAHTRFFDPGPFFHGLEGSIENTQYKIDGLKGTLDNSDWWINFWKGKGYAESLREELAGMESQLKTLQEAQVMSDLWVSDDSERREADKRGLKDLKELSKERAQIAQADIETIIKQSEVEVQLKQELSDKMAELTLGDVALKERALSQELEKMREQADGKKEILDEINQYEAAALEDLLQQEYDLAEKQKGITEQKAADKAMTLEETIAQNQAILENTDELMEGMQAAWENYGLNTSSVIQQVSELSIATAEQFAQGVGDAFAQAIIYGEDLGKSFKNLMKQIGANIISTLIQIGVQKLIQWALFKALNISEASGRMAALTAETYAGAFAATAAIPGIGPEIAPAVAAGAVAAMTAGAAGAGAVGSAQGASLGSYDEGGISTVPGTYYAGVKEWHIPLGANRRIPVEMPEQTPEEDEEEPEPQVVNNNYFTVEGDFLAEDDFIESIMDRISDMVRNRNGELIASVAGKVITI